MRKSLKNSEIEMVITSRLAKNADLTTDLQNMKSKSPDICLVFTNLGVLLKVAFIFLRLHKIVVT